MAVKKLWIRALSSYRFTCFFILLASFLNVSFSAIGGLLLYLDSLDQIESSVEELSSAELRANADRLARSFTDVGHQSRSYAHLLEANGTESMSSVDMLQQFYLKQELATLVHSDSVYSVGVFAAPQGADLGDPTGMVQVAWWDPLTNATHIQKHGGDRVWISGTYIPAYYNSSSCVRKPSEYPARSFCVVCHSVDAYGRLRDNVYNYTDKNINSMKGGSWAALTGRWEENGASFWRPLGTWSSEDSTAYAYAAFVRVLPRLSGGLFADWHVAIITYISFYGWFDVIDEDSDATMMAATLAGGGESTVIASNIDLSVLRTECQTNKAGTTESLTRSFCLLKVSELPPLYQEAARVLNSTPHNTFRNVDLAGEDFWVRRASIFTAQGHDLLDPIDLLWMRRHSTVQDKVKRALVNFVLFVVGSAVLSTVGLTMIVVVTRAFAASMKEQMSEVQAAVNVTGQVAHELSMYDVEEGHALLEGDAGSKLPDGLKAALGRLLHNLHEYKPYLPDAMMVRESDVDVATVEPPGLGHERPVVTICFTDIQSSTELWEANSQSMHTALLRHNDIVRRQLMVCSGYEVKVIGDAFMLAFKSVEDGCRFALDVQVALVEAKWPSDLLQHPLCRPCIVERTGKKMWSGPRIRVGLNCGEVKVDKNPVTGRCDYFGPPVNIAARVESCLGYGGLSGCTRAVLDALTADERERLGGIVTFALGDRGLKGVSAPVEVTVLLRPELAERWKTLLDRPAPQLRVESRQSGRRGTDGSNHSTGSASSSFGSAHSGRRRTGVVVMKEGLTQRTATCTTFRARADKVLTGLGMCLAEMLEMVEQAADMTQGVLVSTVSVQCVVVWNGPRVCADHYSQCLRASDFVRRSRLDGVAAGACSGELLHGNVSAGRKKHATVVGGCVELSAALAEEAEACDEELLAATTFALYCRSLQRTRRFGKWSVRGGPGCFEVLSVSEPVAMAELAELRLDVVDGAENNGGADSTCLESLDDPKVLPVNDSDSEPTEPAGRQVLVGAGVATGGIGFD